MEERNRQIEFYQSMLEHGKPTMVIRDESHHLKGFEEPEFFLSPRHRRRLWNKANRKPKALKGR